MQSIQVGPPSGGDDYSTISGALSVGAQFNLQVEFCPNVVYKTSSPIIIGGTSKCPPKVLGCNTTLRATFSGNAPVLTVSNPHFWWESFLLEDFILDANNLAAVGFELTASTKATIKRVVGINSFTSTPTFVTSCGILVRGGIGQGVYSCVLEMVEGRNNTGLGIALIDNDQANGGSHIQANWMHLIARSNTAGGLAVGGFQGDVQIRAELNNGPGIQVWDTPSTLGPIAFYHSYAEANGSPDTALVVSPDKASLVSFHGGRIIGSVPSGTQSFGVSRG